MIDISKEILALVERRDIRYSGKVRDVYETNIPGVLWIETSNRISVFDVVLGEEIPNKGAILAQLSAFWVKEVLTPLGIGSDLIGLKGPNVSIVWELKMLPIEAIVRAFLFGSVVKEYDQTGMVLGHDLPPNLQKASALPRAIFTPSTKAALGEHDQNLTRGQAIEVLSNDVDLFDEVERICLRILDEGQRRLGPLGIILADTKFELGFTPAGQLVVGDEVLTPDSSRFWMAYSVEPGSDPISFDKQPVRDELAALDWDKEPPAPSLSDESVGAAEQRYLEAFRRITGRDPVLV